MYHILFIYQLMDIWIVSNFWLSNAAGNKYKFKIVVLNNSAQFFFFNYLFTYLAALGLHCCTRAFSSCGEQGLLFIVVCRLLIAVASLAEHGL